MGVPSRYWRISSLNQSYALCSTYPSVLVVPKRSTDSELLQARSFRSRHRLPVFVWRRRLPDDEGRGAVLLRCSQPMVGIMNARSSDDELLLNNALASNPAASLLIVDARPVANARANLALGAGTELAENYVGGAVQRCHVEYLGVENIHVMRKSYKALWKLCVKICEGEGASTAGSGSGVTAAGDGGSGGGGAGGGSGAVSFSSNAQHFWTGFIATQHFTHLAALLSGASFIANTLSSPSAPSVCLHCSDGWDRTPQLTALALLLLDPHYRTITGLAALIDKEFSSFGHKFLDRVGLGSTHAKGEDAPVFHQFIDCVYQLQRQHRSAFEWKEALLLWLLDSLYCGRWGSWMANSEYERVKAGVMARSASVWAEVGRERHRWLYAGYQRQEAALQVDVRAMGFWREYYLRWDYHSSGGGGGRAPAAGGGDEEAAVERERRRREQSDEEAVRLLLCGLVLEVGLLVEQEESARKERRIAELDSTIARLQRRNGLLNGK